jgi:5-methylthioadenosine/S-adenosylhomocysteine deaminase
MPKLETADVLIKNARIVTLNPRRDILKEATIAVRRDRIVAIEASQPGGAVADAEATKWQAKDTIDAAGMTVFPGLVNTHNHLFQSLLKGMGDDLVLKDWFRATIRPASVHLTVEDCNIAALLGCAEAVRSGTTTMLDFMYPHPRPYLSDAVIAAFRQIGIRGILARGYFDTGVDAGIPAEIVQPTGVILDDCERLIQTYHGSDGGRTRVWIAPCAIWGLTEDGIVRSHALAAKYPGVGLTMHVAETPWEIENSTQRFGLPDLAFLDSLGVLGPAFLAVHCVYLDERAIRILKLRDVRVSHNPHSNMYLASGAAPIPQMLLAGVTVSLGADGAASNNNQNMIQMMKSTALLHKVVHRDPTIITAEKVLEMATIDGAVALGLDREIGSVEVGKKADLSILDFNTLATTPDHHPVSTLVYSAIGAEVDTVLIDGRVIVRGRKLQTVDEAALLKEAGERARGLARRAGMRSAEDRPWRSSAV